MSPGGHRIQGMGTRWVHAALALVLSATLGSSAVAECMSGRTTADAQMACCKAGHHHCHTTVDGHSCCPTVKQAIQQVSAVKTSPAPDLRVAANSALVVPVLFAPPLVSAARVRPATDPPGHAPPNILASALRI